ncbi:MAG: S41 family peptidase [Taibaiella sp.]|nr:S41 family peptidase [Taibaiella sp.]
MTEREFQFFLLPVIGMVHCSHTKLLPSQYLLDHINEYCTAPPVRAYFTARKAYITDNFTADTTIKPGAELVSVNGIATTEITKNFMARMTQEGRNTTFIYNRMNAAVWPKNGLYGFFPGIGDYPTIDSYTVSYINPGSKTVATTRLAAMRYDDYPPVLESARKKKIDFRIADKTGIMTIASFSVPYPEFHNFIDSVFATLKTQKIANLVIDLRGNLGGIPEETVELLAHLLKSPFIYFREGNGYDDYKKPTDIAQNRFDGRVYFLVDGGCRSSTGHFLAMARYHKIGTMIGEESCGSFSCNDNGRPYTLPNTRLIFQCPGSTYTVATTGIKRGNGIVPDYIITPGVDDIVKGKDTVLNFALHLIH